MSCTPWYKNNLTFVALKARKTSSFRTIFYFKKPKKKQATCCLDFQSSIFSLSLGLDTLFFAINVHIDCLNNSKCSVMYIFKATKQGALESVFASFSIRLTVSGYFT